jgi:adenylate cyclase
MSATTGKTLYRHQIIASLICWGGVITFTLFCYFAGLFQNADNFLYDINMTLRGPIATTGRISLVLMDEGSAVRLQRERGQWSRSNLAAALDNLCTAGAEVVGLDMVMSAPDQNAEEDQNLIAAISRCNNVVLARVSSARGVHEIAPLDALQEVMIGDGFIDVPLDQDGVLRRIRFVNAKPQQEGGLELLPSFALELARVYLNLEFVFDFTGADYFLLGAKDRHIRLPYPELLVNYAGDYTAFDVISFADAANNTFDPALVKGRLVVVGSTLSSEKDFFTTPLSRFRSETSNLHGRFAATEMYIQGSDEPGVACHAHAIENILSQNFLRHMTGPPGVLLCLACGIAGLLFYLPRIGWVFELVILLVNLVLIVVLSYFALTKWLIRVDSFPLILISLLLFVGGVILQNVFGHKQTAMITSMFGKYLSSSVVKELIKGDITTTLEGQKATLSILFSDLRGFTAISEKLGARDTALLLNTYFDTMIPLVFAQNGTLDKLMGDAIMAFFGAPVEVTDYPAKGAATALNMIKELKILKQRRDIKGLDGLEIGIGLNIGEVTVGNLGSHDFMNYTIVGDAVNLASRLEGLNKIYGTAILLSQFIANELDDRFVVRDLDIVRVKGKQTAVKIYELVEWRSAITDIVLAGLTLFEKGLAAYRRQDWNGAEQLFKQVLQKLPDDGPTNLYLGRLERMRANPPGPGWDGISTFDHK